MSKEMPPNRCPLINSCIEYIDEEFFNEFCDTTSWIACECAKGLAKRNGWLKKPREWAKELDE